MFAEVNWSVSFYDVCKSLTNKDYESRAKILKLPTTENITADTLIFDACGNLLKQKLSEHHPSFNLESVRLDTDSRIAYVYWDLSDAPLTDYLTKLKHSELLDLLGLHAFIEIPEHLQTSNTNDELFLGNVSDFLKSTFEMPFTSFKVTRFKEPSEYRSQYIKADYYTCVDTEISEIEDALGIDWRDVEDFEILSNVLYIRTQNSPTRLTYKLHKPILDDRYPFDVEIVSK